MYIISTLARTLLAHENTETHRTHKHTPYHQHISDILILIVKRNKLMFVFPLRPSALFPTLWVSPRLRDDINTFTVRVSVLTAVCLSVCVIVKTTKVPMTRPTVSQTHYYYDCLVGFFWFDLYQNKRVVL